MYNSVKGRLTGRHESGIYIESGGIEWELLCPLSSLDAFGELGSEAKAYTWLYHREDQMSLFGFPTREERAVFLSLIKVDGIGPRQSLKILSGIRAAELARAVAEGDLGRLEAVNGVGKKTAQKILLALKGELVEEAAPGKKAAKGDEEIVRSLADMGFDRRLATEAVADIARERGLSGRALKEAEAEVLREAIVRLST